MYLKCINLWKEFRELPMKWQFSSFCGVLSLLLFLSLLVIGCSVEKDFVALMDHTNADIIRDWSEDAKVLPGMNQLNEDAQKKLIRDMLSAAYVQRLAIDEFKKKKGVEK